MLINRQTDKWNAALIAQILYKERKSGGKKERKNNLSKKIKKNEII